MNGTSGQEITLMRDTPIETDTIRIDSMILIKDLGTEVLCINKKIIPTHHPALIKDLIQVCNTEEKGNTMATEVDSSAIVVRETTIEDSISNVTTLISTENNLTTRTLRKEKPSLKLSNQDSILTLIFPKSLPNLISLRGGKKPHLTITIKTKELTLTLPTSRTTNQSGESKMSFLETINPFKQFKNSKVPKTTLNKGTVMTPLKSITRKNKTNSSKKSNKKMISTSLNLLNHLTIRSQD